MQQVAPHVSRNLLQRAWPRLIERVVAVRLRTTASAASAGCLDPTHPHPQGAAVRTRPPTIVVAASPADVQRGMRRRRAAAFIPALMGYGLVMMGYGVPR